MANLDALHPYVLPELPRCPTPIVNRVIVDSLREFCRRTNLLRKTENLTITIGQSDYSLSPPADMEILEISRVSEENRDIPLYTEHSGLIKLADDSVGEVTNYYTWQPQSTVIIHPEPNLLHRNTLDVIYSYQPVRTSTEIPDDIFDRWAECLAAKVKSVLMAQARKDWSNPEYVGINKAEWWRLLGDARSESHRMYGNPVSAAVYSLDQG